MCRMFGVVSAHPVALGALLSQGARSLAALSHEHCDGWGIALKSAAGWIVEKRAACAARCTTYAELASTATAAHAIAHVRKKTVGDAALANTHPFRRDRFVFAHNGTLPGVVALHAKTSARRLAEIAGDTDSERLFAFVLSSVDETNDVSHGLALAAAELQRRTVIGSASFLFSDGERMFAFRQGRTLFAASREHAAVVASEPLTAESWTELREGSLTELSSEGQYRAREVVAPTSRRAA
jgi:predicted glutamine amidotransferase